MNVPELPHNCNSWIVTRKDTGEAVLETYSRQTVERINFEVYRVQTALDYLCELNAR